MARSGLSIENVRNALKTIGNRSKELGYEELLDVVGTFKQLPHEEHLEFVNKVAGKFHIGFFLIMMKVIDELLNDVLKDVLKNIKLVKENN